MKVKTEIKGLPSFLSPGAYILHCEVEFAQSKGAEIVLRYAVKKVEAK